MTHGKLRSQTPLMPEEQKVKYDIPQSNGMQLRFQDKQGTKCKVAPWLPKVRGAFYVTLNDHESVLLKLFIQSNLPSPSSLLIYQVTSEGLNHPPRVLGLRPLRSPGKTVIPFSEGCILCKCPQGYLQGGKDFEEGRFWPSWQCSWRKSR